MTRICPEHKTPLRPFPENSSWVCEQRCTYWPEEMNMRDGTLAPQFSPSEEVQADELAEWRLAKITRCFYAVMYGYREHAIDKADLTKIPADFIDKIDTTSERERAKVRITVKDSGIRIRTFAWVMGHVQDGLSTYKEWI